MPRGRNNDSFQGRFLTVVTHPLDFLARPQRFVPRRYGQYVSGLASVLRILFGFLVAYSISFVLPIPERSEQWKAAIEYFFSDKKQSEPTIASKSESDILDNAANEIIFNSAPFLPSFPISDKHRLFTHKPTTTGTQQPITVQNRTYELTTLSKSPLIFEISHYLTPAQCDSIVELVQKRVPIFWANLSHNIPHIWQPTSFVRTKGVDILYDIDGDGYLNITEIQKTINLYSRVWLEKGDIALMFNQLGYDLDADHRIGTNELLTIRYDLINEWVTARASQFPFKKNDYGKVMKLNMQRTKHDTIRTLYSRLSDLTSLPHYILHNSVELKVIHFPQLGHRWAFYDASTGFNPKTKNTADVKCCFQNAHKHTHQIKIKFNNGAATITHDDCVHCSFVTLIYYLSDVARGGDMVFPLSDKHVKIDDDYESWEFFYSEMNDPWKYCSNEAATFLNNKGSEQMLRIQAEKGKLVIVYHDNIDELNGWKKSNDMRSLRADCTVWRGEKYVAVHHIQVGYDGWETDYQLFFDNIRRDTNTAQ